jgi:hypothetical protein
LACHHIDDKKYIDDYVVPLYEKIYGIKPKARLWSKGAYGFRIHSKDIVEFKKDILRLPTGSKQGISIPEQILEKQNLKKAFLRGFISTDGSINTFLANKRSTYPRIEMCNISMKLMEQINQILNEFGFRTSTWIVNKNKQNWHEALRLTLNGFEMLEKWNDEIGFTNPKQIKKLRELEIKSNIFK